jgi:hypothetical protein
VIACIDNGLAVLYKLVALGCVSSSLWFYLSRYHLRSKPYQLSYNEQAQWWLITENTSQTLQILPSSVITTWLIVLHFRLENGQFQSLLIVKDALSTADYRTLVVTLKIAGLQDEQE